MRQILRYFREHPWQRLTVTLLAAVVVGSATALVVTPIAVDLLLIHRMGSEDASIRELAIVKAVERARESPATVRRLDAALDGAGDVKFAAIATVLNQLGKFKRPGRDPAQIDRQWTIRLKAASLADTRMLILERILVSAFADGRRSAHVRRACDVAAADSEPRIRARAALLAAILQDDKTLEKLLADKENTVKAAAILDAGLAARRGIVDGFAPRLLASQDVGVASSAAYALHSAGGEQAGSLLAAALGECRNAELRDRLLYVMGLRSDKTCADAVRKVILGSKAARETPSAMALLAAGKLKVAEASPAVRAALDGATRKGSSLSESQVLAALQAADMLNLPVRKHVNRICTKLWHPDLEFTMIAAARLLGRQVNLPQSWAPSRSECIRTLRLAATYARAAPAGEGRPEEAVATPLASAAAAVALWELAPSVTEFSRVPEKSMRPLTSVLKIDRESSALYVRAAARNSSTLAGDCVAWHIARSGHPKAFSLGLVMLPAVGARLPVYNDNERSAGAMLLALAAKTPEQRSAAARRITSRLVGGPMGGEDDHFVSGAYRCALSILGEVDGRQIRALLDTGPFPQRRAITALLVRGDKKVLDDLLWGPHVTPEDVIFLLTHKGIGEVVATLAPDLPTLQTAARGNVMLWQVKILRDCYAIRRSEIKVGLKR